jgi:hypothetical protein
MRSWDVRLTRRAVPLTLWTTLLVAAACSTSGTSTSHAEGPGTSTRSAATTTLPRSTRTTSTSLGPVADLHPCDSRQLQGQLRGIQGAAGNWAAAFWFSDVSGRACKLDSPVRVDLLDRSDRAELSISANFAPIALTADTQLPPQTSNGSGQLGDFTLFWPTDADVAASRGSTSGLCPTTVLVPSAVRFTFSEATRVTISNQSATGDHVRVCGRELSIVFSGPV